MGILDRIAGRVRTFWDGSRRHDARQIAVGSTGASSLGTGFDLLSAYGQDSLSSYMQLDHGLLERFADYEEMDDYPLITAALDIYADDATQTDMQTDRSVWVTAPDRRVQTALNDLLHRTLNIESEKWEIGRTLCKYGQDYEEVLVTENGVVGLNYLPPATMRRIEGPRGELFGFIQDFHGKIGYTLQEFDSILQQRAESPPSRGGTGLSQFDPGADMQWVAGLEDWEVVHFRLRGKQRRSVYGHSVLEAARFIYRRLMLLEDAAMIFRLQRAPEKLAFYVDVGQMPSNEALAHLRRIRNDHRKKQYMDPSTGKLALKMEAFSNDADYWIPSRDGKDSTRIETVTSPAWQHMEDVNYFRDQLFAAMKIPKAYLGGDEGVVNSVLSSQDVRFARTVLRVQQSIRDGLEKVCRVHIAALGMNPDQVEYQLHMTVPSSIFELAQLEARNARADLASRMKEFVSLPWVLSDIFGMSDQDVKIVLQQRDQDSMRDMVAQAKGQAAAQKFMPAPPEGGAPGGAPASQGGPASGGEAVDLYPQARRQILLPRRDITEREMNAIRRGPAERKQADKLDRLLKNDEMLRDRLTEVRELLHTVASFSRPR